MSSSTSYVQKQLVYWAQIAAAATGANITYTAQAGPGALTGGQAASVYTVTMPANFTVPINRRFINIAPNVPLAARGAGVTYDEAASAANTVVCYGFAFGGGALDVGFQLEIYRVELLP